MRNLQHIFIAGAAKAGTTSLYYLLAQHPEICTPVVKEPNYFNNLDHKNDVVKPGCGPGDEGTVWTSTREAYDELYKIKEQHHFRLDASVAYLYSHTAARQIAEYDPDARIIILLRNPVERAWSHYRHLVRDGRETRSFERALHLEKKRIKRGWEFSWHLKQMGLYSEQIERYFHHFGREQIGLFLFDDLKNNMKTIIEETAEVAGLPAFDYDFNQKRQNVSGVSRSRGLVGLANYLARYKRTINKIIPPSFTHKAMQIFRSLNTQEGGLELKDKTRQELIEYFRSDIQKTSRLIDRNLTSWLT